MGSCITRGRVTGWLLGGYRQIQELGQRTVPAWLLSSAHCPLSDHLQRIVILDLRWKTNVHRSDRNQPTHRCQDGQFIGFELLRGIHSCRNRVGRLQEWQLRCLNCGAGGELASHKWRQVWCRNLWQSADTPLAPTTYKPNANRPGRSWRVTNGEPLQWMGLLLPQPLSLTWCPVSTSKHFKLQNPWTLSKASSFMNNSSLIFIVKQIMFLPFSIYIHLQIFADPFLTFFSSAPFLE